MATSTVEDYLKHILLAEERAPEARVSMGQIATALGVAPGTVTAMMKTLADGGLVEYEPYSGVRLSAPGRQLATHVLRRHLPSDQDTQGQRLADAPEGLSQTRHQHRSGERP